MDVMVKRVALTIGLWMFLIVAPFFAALVIFYWLVWGSEMVEEIRGWRSALFAKNSMKDLTPDDFI